MQRFAGAKMGPGAPGSPGVKQLSLLKMKIKDQKRIPKSSPFPAEEEYKEISLVLCQVCGRNFSEDRIVQHARVCKHAKPRKIFDPSEHRTRNTELAQFFKAAKIAEPNSKSVKQKSQEWKRRSEELRDALSSARAPAGLKAKGAPGGAPKVNTSFIPCPHCQRRFNAKAAERHIPLCSSIVNRPKRLERGSGRKAYSRV
uniref:C2HC/C3H-type domain-containing protein n=1 Tax=Spongospora subterranea TaxID=70186 RepID=A0A0H5RS92_9EUKA|eukprot:CRZ11609.1 hypothetical protein [Spongospora subterranea]